MKTQQLAAVLLTLLFALPALCSSVVIGDFEGGSLDGWSPAGSAATVSLSASTTGATLGSGSLQVNNAGTGYSWGAINKNIMRDQAAIAALTAPGATVTIDFLAQGADVPGPSMSLTLLVNGDNGGSAANEQMATTAVTVDGTTHSMTFALTDSARAILANSTAWAFVGFSDNSTNTRIWYVDKIQVSAPSAAAPVVTPELPSAPERPSVTEAVAPLVTPSNPPSVARAASSDGNQIVGNPDFIHLVQEDGIWWFADHTGKRFITIGMNHIDEGKILFNEVNEGWLQKEFGDDIKAPWGALNPRAENIGAFADMVVADFKDYGFNTIPFHAYSVPLLLYEERQTYFVAKIKVQQICLMHMKRDQGERFPDVFSSAFAAKLDALANKICTPLRDAKYCLGYTFFDMPDLKSIRNFQRWMFPDKGLIYPWVQDMRELPATAEGKQKWMAFLQQNHASAAAAANVYGIQGVSSWEALADVTSWPVQPADEAKALKDAEEMFTAIAEQWYRLHHDTIKKYDPNHLILGDKHDVGYDKSVHMIPDGVLEVMGKYTDAMVIQSYSLYADHHKNMLTELHTKSGLPIINGDHSYSCPNHQQEKTKGIKLASQEAVANEYHSYMKNIMTNHPYMLGWWYCGYIEQWAPAGTHLGQQCGFFTPFGEPRTDLLPMVQEANENAVEWHQNAR